MNAMTPLRILVVEDNDLDLELLNEEFRYFKVINPLHRVASGDEALDHLLRRTEETRDAPRPDLVLLDIHLPDCLGHDLLEVIRGTPELSDLQAVMLTSSEADEDLLRAHGSGADGYLLKPITQRGIIHLCSAMDDLGFSFVVADNGEVA